MATKTTSLADQNRADHVAALASLKAAEATLGDAHGKLSVAVESRREKVREKEQRLTALRATAAKQIADAEAKWKKSIDEAEAEAGKRKKAAEEKAIDTLRPKRALKLELEARLARVRDSLA